jgi:hypothetical protein
VTQLRHLIIPFVFLLLFITEISSAGRRVEQVYQNSFEPTQKVATSIQIEGNRIKSDTRVGGTLLESLIYDGNRVTLWVLDHKRKIYIERNKPQLLKSKETYSAFLQKSPISYKSMGTKKIDKWNCESFEVFRSKKKTNEICVADPSELGLTASEAQLLRLSKYNTYGPGSLPYAKTSNEIIIEDKMFAMDKPALVSTLIQITEEKFDPSVFAIPASYLKRDQYDDPHPHGKSPEPRSGKTK